MNLVQSADLPIMPRKGCQTHRLSYHSYYQVRISALKQIATDFAPGGIGLSMRTRKSSITLENDTELLVSATPEELASLKHLFNSFDVESNGFITIAGTMVTTNLTTVCNSGAHQQFCC